MTIQYNKATIGYDKAKNIYESRNVKQSHCISSSTMCISQSDQLEIA